jgi:hypothetical protein
VVPDGLLTVRISGSQQPSLPAGPRTDIRAGVVPGGGFVLLRAGALIDPSAHAKTVATERLTSGQELTGTVEDVRPRTPVETSSAKALAGTRPGR